MKHSSKGLEVLLKFFHDTYELANLRGNPLLMPGEKLDRGQQLQSQANVEHIATRLEAEGVLMVETDYEPIPHDQWKPGDTVVNVRTGSVARLTVRKVPPFSEPFPGWWIENGGGIADFVKEWRSIACLLAERQRLGL